MKQKGKIILTVPISYKSTIVFLFCITISGCSYESDVHNNLRRDYFDVRKYFETEAAYLNEYDASLKKTLLHGLDKEIVFNDTVDWVKEFAPFLAIDINKPAFTNGYQIDSTRNQIKYTAKDSSFEVKSIKIQFEDKDVSRISFVLRKKNMYYYSIESLVYYARNKYAINIDNNLKAGSRVMFEITGDIIIDTDLEN